MGEIIFPSITVFNSEEEKLSNSLWKLFEAGRGATALSEVHHPVFSLIPGRESRNGQEELHIQNLLN